MKCMVIKASPRGIKASSSRLADAFIGGLKSSGADVTEVMLKDKEIKHCTGCYTCWTRTPGRCVLRDDMDILLPQLEQADLVVYATPLYYFSVPGKLKDLMDRGLPMLDPFLIPGEERTGHPRRKEKEQRFVLISTAGFPEKSVFRPLEALFETELENSEEAIAGKILITGAEVLFQDGYQEACKELYQLVEQAGEEVGKGHAIPEEIYSAIDSFQEKRQESSEKFSEIANAYWESLRPSETNSPIMEELRPQPGDKLCSLSAGGMETLMSGMALLYRPEVEPGLESVMQYDFGEEQFYLLIGGESCKAYRGIHSQAAFTVKSPPDVWEAVSNGSLSGAQGLISDKYQVEGDMALFMKTEQLFATNSSSEERGPEPVKEVQKKGRGPLSLSGAAWMTLAFIPWMVLWAGPAFLPSPFVSYGAFVLSLFLCLYHFISNKVTFFEGGTLIFMALNAHFAWRPNPLYSQGVDFFQYLFLAGLWGGLLMRRFSLTGEYIRHDFPASVWKLPSFTDTNRILTAAWSLYYCVAALLRYIEGVSVQPVLLHFFPFMLLLPMFLFTGWFQKWYPVKMMQESVS